MSVGDQPNPWLSDLPTEIVWSVYSLMLTCLEKKRGPEISKQISALAGI